MTKIEQGRSMVEMLGVLAIIGVLSIGGIAGYNMAMNRYKANEILDMASKLSVAAKAARSTANNDDVWQDAMLSVAEEFEADNSGLFGNHAIFMDGPYESTYMVQDDGRVDVFVIGNQPALRNAIDSVAGASGVSSGQTAAIKGE